MVAVLAIAAAAAGPAWGQTTYNVTFSGFSMGYINTTVNVTSLPQTFTSVDDYDFTPWNVFSDASFEFTGAPVTSGGEGKVSANFVEGDIMSITVSGTFEGTATIHVTGNDDDDNPISTDVYVSCAAPAVPITVRMAAGTEEAEHWSIASGNASVDGTQVLENVMSGSQVTATYNGTQKVKSVKAVKYVPPAATVATAPTAAAAIIEAGSTTALVGAGTANGGTMMYAVTTTNTKPTSTDGFSASIPTAQGRTAGTYYVWYYAKADAEHSDSEIAGPVSVTLPVITTVTINQSDWGEWGKSFTKDGVTVSVGNIDRGSGNLMGGGTFSTTLGNFTRIVVTTGSCEASGTGWSGSYSSMTWAGTPASTVSFNDNFMGMGMVQTTIVCTIVLNN